MKHKNCYRYPKSQREIINGKRHYDVGKEKLPSVTTIFNEFNQTAISSLDKGLE